MGIVTIYKTVEAQIVLNRQDAETRRAREFFSVFAPLR